METMPYQPHAESLVEAAGVAAAVRQPTVPRWRVGHPCPTGPLVSRRELRMTAARSLSAAQAGVLRRPFLRNDEYLDQARWTILAEDRRQAKAVWSAFLH